MIPRTPLLKRKLRTSPGLFARIITADFACPRCDCVHRLGLNTARRKLIRTKSWDPTTCRFQCVKCGLTLRLGIIAWPVMKRARISRAPLDTIPTYQQALQLRRKVNAVSREKLSIRGEGASVNTLSEAEIPDDPGEEFNTRGERFGNMEGREDEE